MTSRRFLTVFVFTTGFAVTAVEITASRALAPFFGTSLFVWANVITVVLLALALGYTVGGRIADRRPSGTLLAALVLAAGVLSALIPLAVRAVAYSLIGSAANVSAVLILISFLATAILFFPPVFLLGMVTPFAIRLASRHVEESGRLAGAIFAASTVGSILGVVLTAFLTIPFLGVRETFLIASTLLILIASVGMVKKSPWAFLLLLVPIVLYFATKQGGIRPGENLLEERDSAYQYLRVLEEEGDTRVLRINDGIGFQSLYHPDRLLFGAYFDYYAVLPYLLPERDRIDVLLVGLAGGTIARQYDEIVGKDFAVAMDGVEIDRDVVALGRKYFELDRPMLTVHVADGRMFLAGTDKRYDLIIVDAYSQQVYIPPHLTTQEFFALAEDHLKDDGALALNVNVFSDDAELLQRIALTLESVFSEVRLRHLPELTNVLLLAGNEPLEYTEVARRVPQELLPYALVVQEAERPAVPGSSRRIFTDNRAPVELLTESMFFDLLLQYNGENS